MKNKARSFAFWLLSAYLSTISLYRISSKYCSNILSLYSFFFRDISGNPPRARYSLRAAITCSLVFSIIMPFSILEVSTEIFLKDKNSLKLKGNTSKVIFLPVNKVEYSFFNKNEQEPLTTNLSLVFRSYFFRIQDSHPGLLCTSSKKKYAFLSGFILSLYEL